jgi:hypothetical protein
MGKEDDSDLAFFPAMSMPLGRKLKLMDEFFELLLRSFEPVTMGQHVKAIVAERDLRLYQPTFAH